MLEAALRLYRLGWSVVPAASPAPGGGCDCGRRACPSPGKHPRVPWAAYQSRRASEAELRTWWARWPRASISVVTGAVSGIVVIDVDPAHGGDESLRDLGDLPDTVTALTGGGGEHLYYRHPGGDVPSRTGWRPGIDIRADGGQVIAPPSAHASGRPYTWEAGRAPWEIELAVLPPRLAAELASAAVTTSSDWDLERALTTPIPEGARNAELTRIVGGLVARHRDDPITVLALARDVNRRLCQPPLPDDEVDGIVRSIWRRDVRARAGAAAAGVPVVDEPPPADDAQPGPAERADRMAAIWRGLGVRSVDVVAVRAYEVGDDVTWHLVLGDGRTLAIGTDLFSWSAVFRAVANRVGDVLAECKAADWRRAMAAVVAMAERVVAEDQGAERIEAWVRMMADARGVHDDDAGRVDALRMGCVVVRRDIGDVWVSLGRILAMVELDTGERVPPRTAAVWMRAAGWERGRLGAGGGLSVTWPGWYRPIREDDPWR